MNTLPPSRPAFTVIELIAVTTIIAVVGVLGATLVQRAAAANTQVTLRGTLYAEASTVMDRVLRQLQRTPVRAEVEPASASIAAFTPVSVMWDDQSTLVFDGSTQTLTLCDTSAGDSPADAPQLAQNVAAFSLAPLDQNGANLFTSLGVTELNASQAGAVQRVAVQLTMSRDGESVSLRSRAFLRCRMAKAGAP